MAEILRRLAAAFTPRIARLDDTMWQSVLCANALFDPLDAPARERLRTLTERFLAKKRFSAVAGLELDERMRVSIATLACLPVLHLGFDWLAGWREVIVYPGEFRVNRQWHDERTGVVSEGHDELIGEAWERGPLILSWADIRTDIESPHAGLNVVIHEIAHKIDMLDGAADGVPPMPRHIARREWIATMQRAYDAHVRAVDHGRETAIDPYAAESADEYFAVVAEMYFSTPAALAAAAPDVARLLGNFFGPAPA